MIKNEPERPFSVDWNPPPTFKDLTETLLDIIPHYIQYSLITTWYVKTENIARAGRVGLKADAMDRVA